MWKFKDSDENNPNKNNPDENDPKNYEFSCLGALINAKLILINIDCFEKLMANSTVDNIGILTYSMFCKGDLPKIRVVERSHRIRKTGTRETKYNIVYVRSFTQY